MVLKVMGGIHDPLGSTALLAVLLSIALPAPPQHRWEINVLSTRAKEGSERTIAWMGDGAREKLRQTLSDQDLTLHCGLTLI